MGIFRQFPYSNFHEMNMDQIIKIMRQMQDEWDDVKDEWDDMQSFINNYFNTLDLDEETEKALRRLLADGTLQTYIDPYIADEVGDWLSAHVTPTTPAIDKSLTVSNAAADALTTGNYIYSLLANNPATKTFTDTSLAHGYWSSVGGVFQPDEEWRAVKAPIRVKPGCFITTNININYRMYNEARTYVGTRNSYTLESQKDNKPVCIPNNVYYIAPYIQDTSVTEITITIWNASECTNFEQEENTDNQYIFFPNCWMTADGGMHTVGTLNCILAPNLQEGGRYYVSNNSGVQCVCLNDQGQILTPTKVFDAYSNGNIFTIPVGTRITIFNLYKSHTDQSGNIYTDYVTKITQDKKILCLGDSITWLDGTDYGNVAYYVGYQKELRKLGYEVDKRAWSGFSFTTGVNPTDPSTSLYKEIVTNQLNVANYKYITLFGGTNDIQYDSPIGTAPNDYSYTEYNNQTFNSAVSGVLQYLRDNNPTAKIVMINMPKSEAASRPYTKSKNYVDNYQKCADFWSCPVVDLFNEMNISPQHNFTNYFYDSTHPNYQGQRIIGNMVANKIKELEM